MSDAIRDRARAWLDKWVPWGLDVTSDGETAARFTKITGLNHDSLVKEWKAAEGPLPPGAHRKCHTSCIEFACTYCGEIGLPSWLGASDVHQRLKGLGREDAWIQPAPGRYPQQGDICRWAPPTFHVGISFAYLQGVASEGHANMNVWYTVEGGQGGPQYDKNGKFKGGHDIVRRNTYPDPNAQPARGPYRDNLLEGWVDIELFVGSSQLDSDSQATLDLWLNQDDEVVYPDALAGGGGPGFFRSAGPLSFYPSAGGLPHPDSPAARSLDPLEIQRINEDRNKG